MSYQIRFHFNCLSHFLTGFYFINPYFFKLIIILLFQIITILFHQLINLHIIYLFIIYHHLIIIIIFIIYFLYIHIHIQIHFLISKSQSEQVSHSDTQDQIHHQFHMRICPSLKTVQLMNLMLPIQF